MGVRNLSITSDLAPAESRPFEVVERKGIGHPDTLADGVAEAISIEYSDYTLKKFGAVLHQTLDKIMFIGGSGKFGYGVGEMLKPWRLILNGRLTKKFSREEIPYREIAENAAKNYLKKTVPKLDVEKWLKIESFTSSNSKNPRWFNPKSLSDVPDATNPYANDTSTCVGYWPLSTTEKLALLLEGYFYDKQEKPRFSYIGQDIKVMCVRKQNKIEITMCVPSFSQETPSFKVYSERKREICSGLKTLAEEFVKGRYEIDLYVNTQDEMIKSTANSIGHYFVISGSALDSGEEGVVGRGNRSRGIISNLRPCSIEAIHGKNPVYYVGKVYSYLADLLAKKTSEELECECQVYISSRNSDPLSMPYHMFIETSEKRGEKQIMKLVRQELSKKSWTEEIINDKPFLPRPGGGNGYLSKSNSEKS